MGAPSSSRRRSALAARRGIFARLGTTPAAPTPPSPSRAAEARSSAPALALRPRPPRTVASTTSRASGASRHAATCLVATALPAAAASCPRAGPCGSGPDRPGSPRVGATAAPRPGPRGTLALGQQVPAHAALGLELLQLANARRGQRGSERRVLSNSAAPSADQCAALGLGGGSACAGRDAAHRRAPHAPDESTTCIKDLHARAKTARTLAFPGKRL